MEQWLLVEDFNGKSCILDRCFTSSKEKAQSAFDGEGWVLGNVVSEADFLLEEQKPKSICYNCSKEIPYLHNLVEDMGCFCDNCI